MNCNKLHWFQYILVNLGFEVFVKLDEMLHFFRVTRVRSDSKLIAN